MEAVKWFYIACTVVVTAAFLGELKPVRSLIEYLYDNVYLAAWRAMMRHAADPAYAYNGRHFR